MLNPTLKHAQKNLSMLKKNLSMLKTNWSMLKRIFYTLKIKFWVNSKEILRILKETTLDKLTNKYVPKKPEYAPKKKKEIINMLKNPEYALGRNSWACANILMVLKKFLSMLKKKILSILKHADSAQKDFWVRSRRPNLEYTRGKPNLEHALKILSMLKKTILNILKHSDSAQKTPEYARENTGFEHALKILSTPPKNSEHTQKSRWCSKKFLSMLEKWRSWAGSNKSRACTCSRSPAQKLSTRAQKHVIEYRNLSRSIDELWAYAPKSHGHAQKMLRSCSRNHLSTRSKSS